MKNKKITLQGIYQISSVVLMFCFFLTLSSCASKGLGLHVSTIENTENLHVDENLTYVNSPLDRLVQETFPVDQASEDNLHYVKVLNIGYDALLAKVHLIRSAQKTINITTFIWDNDEVGRLVIYELIEAAKRGVKVKIVVDDLSLRKIPEFVAFLATAHPNLKIKQYNPVVDKISPAALEMLGSWLVNFKKNNHRMHNKYFIVDDRFGITGGRNIANDYYDYGDRRNFKDREVLVVGPIIRQMTDSFMQYWDFKLSIASEEMLDVKKKIEKGEIERFQTKASFLLGPAIESLITSASNKSYIEKKLMDDLYQVSKIAFIADHPDKRKEGSMSESLTQFIGKAQKSVVLQTPYLIVGKKDIKAFKKLKREIPELDIKVSSNSLSAADHFYAYAFSFKLKREYVKGMKWRIFELKGLPKDNDLMVPPLDGVEREKDYFTCIHAKTYVVDDDKAFIGSFNIDPRSANLNTEAGFIIEDKVVAQAVKKDINRDMLAQNSYTIGKKRKVPILGGVGESIGYIMNLIPIVDIWPFRSTASFRLKPGKSEISCFDENFYDHYESVGSFPGVNSSEKKMKTRIIKSLFGVLEPIM